MFKKCLYFLLLSALVFFFVPEAWAQGKLKIAIVKMSSRVKYLETEQGIISGLKKEGFDENKVDFDLRSADDDNAKVEAIAKDLKEKKVAMIFTIGTEVTGILKKEIKDIPIVFSMVANPLPAKLVGSMERVGGNVIGACSETKVAPIINVLRQVAPAKKVAFLYSSEDIQGAIQLEHFQQAQKELMFTVTPANLKNPSEAGDLIKNLVGRIDSIFVGPGNTISKGLSDITSATIEYKIPTITHSLDKVEAGLLLGLGVNPTMGGELSARKAAEVLRGKNPADTSVDYPDSYDIVVNLKVANAMGISIPAGLLKSANKIIKEKKE